MQFTSRRAKQRIERRYVCAGSLQTNKMHAFSPSIIIALRDDGARFDPLPVHDVV